MEKPKLKTVKCTTQELEGLCTLISGIEIKVQEGAWVFDMYKKFKKAFEESAKDDPNYTLQEVENG